MKFNAKYFNSRRFKFGSLATVLTAVVLAAIVLINVVAGLLLERFPVTIDLTADNRFDLTQESVDFLEGVEEEIQLIVLADEVTFESAGTHYKQVYEIVKDYGHKCSKVNVQFVDITTNPELVDRYPNETLSTGDLIVETSKRYKVVKNSTLFTYSTSTYGTATYSSQAEQQITSAMLYVTEAKTTSVGVLTGFTSLVDTTGVEELLKSNVYDVSDVNLLTEDLSKYDVIVLPQPQTDMLKEHLDKVTAFLDNNGEYGKTLLFISSNQEVGPILKNFLAEWGIEAQAGFVFETDSANIYNQQLGGLMFGANVAAEEISSAMNNTGLPIVTYVTTPFKLLYETDSNRETAALLDSAETAIFYPLTADENFDVSAQDQYAQHLVVEGTKFRYDTSAVRYESNVIAFGSPQMLNDSMLTYGGYGNGDFTITTVNNACGKDNAIKIIPIDLTVDTITISQSEIITYGIVFIGVIPVAILVAGIVVFIRRRHL